MTGGGPLIDAAAFDRFAVVLFGSSEVMAAVEAIRQQLPPSGRPILPAHVTVKGTFVNPVDIERTAEMISVVCAGWMPIELTTARCQTWIEGAHVGAWLDVESNNWLDGLQEWLVLLLADHGETIYPGEASGEFRPPLTIVQELPAALEPTVLATITATQHRFTWTAREVGLVGRRGGLAWETLATFPLGAQV